MLSFHSRPAGQGKTWGLPDPSGCGIHCMNELQFAGFGYKQSFGPRQPVFAISSPGHWKPLPCALVWGVVGAWVGAIYNIISYEWISKFLCNIVKNTFHKDFSLKFSVIDTNILKPLNAQQNLLYSYVLRKGALIRDASSFWSP